GRLAAEHPHACRVLERHRIDYCCGGDRTIGDAAARAGVDLADLAREIEAAAPVTAPTASWVERPLPELIEHLVTAYHEPLAEALPQLVRLTRKVCAVHGPGDPERFRELLAAVLTLQA